MNEEKYGSTKGFDRIPYFSDAVIAIAITMLALQIELPETTTSENLGCALKNLWPSYIGFFVSFFVIAVSWRKHHKMFNYIKRYDKRLIQLNILFLFCVAMLPFAANVLGRFPDTTLGVILYAATACSLSVSRMLIWIYATHKHRLVDADLDQTIVRHELRSNITVCTVFGASILVAFKNPAWAMWCWTALLFIPLISRRLQPSDSPGE